MRSPRSLSLALVLALAACGGTSQVVPSAGALPANAQPQAVNRAVVPVPTPTPAYGVVYNFGSVANDGNQPLGALTYSDGVFYGTTAYGGANGDGTVYTLSTAGTESVLHSFGSGSDGQSPYWGLLLAPSGKLFGTTNSGGTSGDGTAFSITTAGKEVVLHSFTGGADGSAPGSSMVDASGTFYGTTTVAGAYNGGTFFSVTPSGTETPLYSFGSGGVYPQPALLNLSGTLYGTTFAGGTHGDGTVFSITPAGVENVIYNFGGTTNDGTLPYGALAYSDGVLYGTTFRGGANNTGTAFSVTLAGTETILHTFGSASDGTNPTAGLTMYNGNLYGTAFSGGTNGDGMIFRLTKKGVESVLHSFGSGTDGINPKAPLTNVAGTLYGTTTRGGTGGIGTVYSITP